MLVFSAESAESAETAEIPEISERLKADNTGIYGRYRVCRNCRSIAENAAIVENFHILDMYVNNTTTNKLVSLV